MTPEKWWNKSWGRANIHKKIFNTGMHSQSLANAAAELFFTCLTIISPAKILIDASKKDKTVREKQLEKEMLCSYVFSPLLGACVVHAKCETSPLIRPPVKNITRNKNSAGISLL